MGDEPVVGLALVSRALGAVRAPPGSVQSDDLLSAVMVAKQQERVLRSLGVRARLQVGGRLNRGSVAVSPESYARTGRHHGGGGLPP